MYQGVGMERAIETLELRPTLKHPGIVNTLYALFSCIIHAIEADTEATPPRFFNRETLNTYMPLIKMETLNIAFILFSRHDSVLKREIAPNAYVIRGSMPCNSELCDQNFEQTPHPQIKLLSALDKLVDLLYTLELS